MKAILIGLTLGICCACAKENHVATTTTSSKSSGTVLAGESSASKTSATDQPNNAADLSLVQDVRRALMDDDTLSLAAQNLTAVARDGTVTLKGTVASEAEKTQVEACVHKVSGVRHIENQITVKSS